jgi:hypothetical protein
MVELPKKGEPAQTGHPIVEGDKHMKTRSIVAAAVLIGTAATATLAQMQSTTYETYLSKGQVQSALSLNNGGFQTYAAAVKNFKGKIVMEYSVTCAGANNNKHNGLEEDEVTVNARVNEESKSAKGSKPQVVGWYIDADVTGKGKLNSVCNGGAEIDYDAAGHSITSTLVLTIKAQGFGDIVLNIPLD